MTKQQKDEQRAALVALREMLKAGDVVYTTLRHVSRSGMQRVIDVHIIKDGAPVWIGGRAARALGMRYDDRRQGVVIGGCGSDMGFEIVYNLSWALWEKTPYQCLGERCPSSDHSNGTQVQCPTCKGSCGEGPHRCQDCNGYGTIRRAFPRGKGVTHTDAYRLRHQWL